MWNKIIKYQTNEVIDKFFDKGTNEELGKKCTFDYSENEIIELEILIIKKEKENGE